jgi:hypothetical protein
MQVGESSTSSESKRANGLGKSFIMKIVFIHSARGVLHAATNKTCHCMFLFLSTHHMNYN